MLAFELLALVHAQKRKYRLGLKAVHSAQTIVADLDETVERNLDYIMAVNTLTGFLLLCIGRPFEALEFILIAEKTIFTLIEKRANRNAQAGMFQQEDTALEVIGEGSDQ